MNNNPIILALDTSTECCSVALINSDKNIYYRESVEQKAHSKLILNFVDEVLLEANLKLDNLDAIAFGCGPGSFTGVRVAASVAQGLAIGINKPIISISSLHALAQNAVIENSDIKKLIAIIDARKQEVYWGGYKKDLNGIMQLVLKDSLCSPDELLKSNAEIEGSLIKYLPMFGAGINTDDYKVNLTPMYPNSKAMLQIAIDKYHNNQFTPVDEAVPSYIRNNVADVPKK